MTDRNLGAEPPLPKALEDMLTEARLEQPGDHLVDQTFQALAAAGTVGAAGLLSSGQASASVLSKVGSTLLTAVKWHGTLWIAGAVIVGAGAVSTHAILSGGEPEPSPPTERRVEAPHAPPGARVSSPDTSPTATPPTTPAIPRRTASRGAAQSPEAELAATARAPANTTAPTAETTPAKPNPSKAQSSPVAGDRAEDPSFLRELALADRARAAIARKDSKTALRLIHAYESEFGKSGNFAPEMRYLKLQAYSFSGDRDRAREAARDILGRDSDRANSARARSELERDPP